MMCVIHLLDIAVLDVLEGTMDQDALQVTASYCSSCSYRMAL